MVRMSKLPYASLAVSLVATGIVSFTGSASHTAWPYTVNNLNDYPMPMKDDSVPIWAVILFGILLWLLFSFMEIRLCNQQVLLIRRIRFAVLIGMTMTEVFFVTATLTTMAKYFVAEPRPDFKMRCLGSDTAVPTYDANGNVICTGSVSVIAEGRYAFPSGHASSSMCFGMFGTLYLLWFVYMRKIHLPWRNEKGCMTVFWYQVSHALFCLCLFPFFVGLAVACTRVRDHRHSPADITAGAFLGTLVSTLYFLVRVVHLSPEHACPDAEHCECGQLYRRVPQSLTSATTSSSSLPPMSATTLIPMSGPGLLPM